MTEIVEPLRLRDLAVTAARRGLTVIAQATTSRAPIAKGSPGDVVTAVDRLVEEELRTVITAVRPEDKIVGEELPDSGDGTSGIEWYLDPIDGTTNFVHGLGLFCTSVAAYDAGTESWVAGAISVPSNGVIYSAAAGFGAEKRLPNGDTSLLRATVPDGAPRLYGAGLSYDPNARAGQLEDIRTRMVDYDDMRSLGTAALALCLVADGTLASFVETDLFVYDWAAGALIAEEAGAHVIRPDGFRGPIEAHTRPS